MTIIDQQIIFHIDSTTIDTTFGRIKPRIRRNTQSVPQNDRTLNAFNVWIDYAKHNKNVSVIGGNQMLFGYETS